MSVLYLYHVSTGPESRYRSTCTVFDDKNQQTDRQILVLVKRQQVAKKDKLAKSVFAALAAGLAGERERDCQVDQQTRNASY